MNLEELKVLLEMDLDDHSRDVVLAIKLEAAINYAQHYCRQSFRDSKGELTLPAAVKLGVATLVQNGDNPVGISSESVGGEMSQSFFSADQTEAANAYFKPFRMVRFA